jgi:hypothetical protein
MVNTRLIEDDMPILAQTPEITATDKAVLRETLGGPNRAPRGAGMMRAAARELAESRKGNGRRPFRSDAHDDFGRAMSEHFDRFCRFPG